MIKYAVAAGLLLLGAQGALAAPACQDQAAGKKLSGAALNSFITKCQKDAKAACQKASADKKLSGAAKSSFEAKCVKDAS